MVLFVRIRRPTSRTNELGTCGSLDDQHAFGSSNAVLGSGSPGEKEMRTGRHLWNMYLLRKRARLCLCCCSFFVMLFVLLFWGAARLPLSVKPTSRCKYNDVWTVNLACWRTKQLRLFGFYLFSETLLSPRNQPHVVNTTTWYIANLLRWRMTILCLFGLFIYFLRTSVWDSRHDRVRALEDSEGGREDPGHVHVGHVESSTQQWCRFALIWQSD